MKSHQDLMNNRLYKVNKEPIIYEITYDIDTLIENIDTVKKLTTGQLQWDKNS